MDPDDGFGNQPSNQDDDIRFNANSSRTHKQIQNHPQHDINDQIPNLNKCFSSRCVVHAKHPDSSHVNLQIYPLLPSIQQIKNELREITNQIGELQIEKYSLESKLKNLVEDLPYNHKSTNSLLGLVDFHGFLIDNPLIDSILQENIHQSSLSQNYYTIPLISTFYDDSFNYKVRKAMTLFESNVKELYHVVFWKKSFLYDRKLGLLRQYLFLRKGWLNYCVGIDMLNVISHDSKYFWGKEQEHSPTIPYDGSGATKGCAPDVPMIIDQSEMKHIFIDEEHRIVRDPVAEYEQFKNRITWTQEEKDRYIEKFYLYPKKFKKIAEFFPNKNVHDMIEAYYLFHNDPALFTSQRKILDIKRGISYKDTNES